jgi:PIN domain nuclease of toxin-antitoxin system
VEHHVTTILLDTHVVHWWSAEPGKLSTAAAKAIDAAGELAVSAITWYELAWLAKHERIEVSTPIRAWLGEIARDVRTVGITPAIADTAVTLSSAFPGDPADRIIYATAVENGWRLVTKDRKLRLHRHPRQVTLW